MRKQILAITLAIMSLYAVPTYAATITAGAGQSVSASSTSTEQKSKSDAQSESDTSDGITWIINRSTPGYELMQKYGTTDWSKAEAIEQVNKWANENKGDIPSIADEKARYEAIVTKVCDFLEYDPLYQAPHIVYSIRDGKGVCAEYTAFTKALCDVCNVQSTLLDGSIEGYGHNMLKVILNGKTYYSDPTNYDAGSVSMLTDSIPSYFDFDHELDPSVNGAIFTGGSVDTDYDVLEMEARKDNQSIIASIKGVKYYGSIEDSIAIDKAFEDDDTDTVHAIWDKYGVPYLK